jgi:hypothetical protein
MFGKAFFIPKNELENELKLFQRKRTNFKLELIIISVE